MNMPLALTRRGLMAAVTVLVMQATPALAQLELKLMAPAAPGGGWDATARSMQSAMVAAGISRSVQVSNVPGAGGTIGLAQLVTSAKGDASQLMVTGFVMVGAISLNKAPVGLAEVTPIARLTSEAMVIVVPATSSIKTAKDLADAVKSDPSKVIWAGGSAGGVDHITAALFAKAAGADATKINYLPFSGGGEALASLLGGRVTAGISGWGEFEGQIKAGKLRAIAVTSRQRLDGNDTPTLVEQGVPMDIVNWRGVVGAPGLTEAQRDTLADAIDRMAKSPQWAEIMKQRGWDSAYLPTREFEPFLKAEQSRVADVLKDVGLVK